MNHLREWVTNEIEPSEYGSYIGLMPVDKSMEHQSLQKEHLYPSYVYWCKTQGITPYSLKIFGQKFYDECIACGLETEKARDNNGYFYRNIVVKTHFLELENGESTENNPDATDTNTDSFSESINEFSNLDNESTLNSSSDTNSLPDNENPTPR